MLKIKTDSKIYLFQLMLLFGICLFTMLQRNGLVSVLFHITFFGLLMGLVIQLIRRPWLNESHVAAVVLVVVAFFHVAMQTNTLALSYYNKLIIFACSVLMLPFLNALEVNRKQVDWILRINLCIAALYPLMYVCLPERGYLGRFLTLHFTNPNLAGMFLVHSALYCAIALYYYKSKMLRLFVLALFLQLAYLIWLTGARSCLVALAFFMVYVVLNSLLKKQIRIPSWLSFVILVSPLVFVLVYLMWEKSGLLQRFASVFSVSKEKTLTSRVELWTKALTQFEGNPLFGAYDVISEGSGMSQMHNTHLDVLASYGVVPFGLFIWLLHKSVNRVLAVVTEDFARMGLFAFYTVIIMGTFEAALVSGGVGLYIMSFGFLILARCRN